MLVASAVKAWRSGSYWLIIPASAVVGVGAGFLLNKSPLLQREARACDKAVATLFDSHDLVDVERAGILIRELDCSINRRLPREP